MMGKFRGDSNYSFFRILLLFFEFCILKLSGYSLNYSTGRYRYILEYDPNEVILLAQTVTTEGSNLVVQGSNLGRTNNIHFSEFYYYFSNFAF
jgi:hypothetical protein